MIVHPGRVSKRSVDVFSTSAALWWGFLNETRTYKSGPRYLFFPRHLWRKLRTTNAIERCFVEVRRRTRPMVVLTNVEIVDRIIYAIFNRFNQDRKNRTLRIFRQAV
jgi:hypothetical protein